MARARKCDRCGRLYENYSGTVNKKLKFNHIVLRDRDVTDSYSNIRWYDLCQQCSKELEKWLLGIDLPETELKD